MIAIQYRDAETEALLECASAPDLPSIGQEIQVGLGKYRVLYRWQCGPGAPVAYLKRMTAEAAGQS